MHQFAARSFRKDPKTKTNSSLHLLKGASGGLKGASFKDLKGASRGLEKGFKEASRGLEKGLKGLEGEKGLKGASR